MREQIVSAVRADRARAIVGERSAELQAALRDGQSFAAAAEAVEADQVSTVTLRRDDQEADPNVRNAVFQVAKPEPGEPRIGTVRTNSGDQAVFAVTGWAPGRPEAIPVQQRDEGKRQLAQQAGQADYTAFVFELERRADVTRNQSALEQAYRLE
ncbi:MAG: hypothetical protein U5K76_07545 [Woeseiaceae bacterium]|nr:hypothetical protein [Woeseiaceae bacterium]